MNTQHAPAVLMVRPAAFGFDTQSAASNTFQHLPTDASATRLAAIAEFNTAVITLRQQGIRVIDIEDTLTPQKPDAIFPNNWFSTWPDGRLYIYPMQAPIRRQERRPDVIAMLEEGFTVTKVIDLSSLERIDMFLEGTGALVFDHIKKVAYGCISSRCNQALFRKHASDLGYTPFLFTATDRQGIPIYHTNVVLAIQTHTAVICTETLPELAQRQQIIQKLSATGRAVIEISYQQMQHFAANILEVANQQGEACVVMSQQAYDAFTTEQRDILSARAKLIPILIPTIETVGGGSARCMLAEIFLPIKA